MATPARWIVGRETMAFYVADGGGVISPATQNPAGRVLRVDLTHLPLSSSWRPWPKWR